MTVARMSSSTDKDNQKHHKKEDTPMPRFKVLEYNQIFMAWMGIHSYRLTEPTNEFFNSPATYYVFFVTIVFSISSSAIFVFRNLSNFQSSLGACLLVIAGLQNGGLFLSTGLNMKRIKVLHLKLQELVDGGMNA